jgi:hypothetical protein
VFDPPWPRQRPRPSGVAATARGERATTKRRAKQDKSRKGAKQDQNKAEKGEVPKRGFGANSIAEGPPFQNFFLSHIDHLPQTLHASLTSPLLSPNPLQPNILVLLVLSINHQH